ncbi:Bifunctional protein: zinc-containing alcohol dehydrogenase; quinone oxidoreductase (NADPH:quinone reductase); Similar to arginate lyase [Leuconostoc inhae]|uniref:Enoyl reductase (ER) domain-containing protein n=2 Tax=Leuconostoc TaxID=1243 RepID=A0ABM9V909_9LACO|nr:MULTISPECIES: NADP-dependent oxidoreductase [Leuconostoc]MBZ5957913.1 NADP-dependent oxidoreductase [Leuconostoc gasicomitatum]MBZ5982116.1 NADP-dependent oxidoreductase [Leuconostoc gasicomitatum]MBZ5987382.1 NADP-dependent oxidoreductase [Leuconostoc gasicomitatum]MBZ5989457.1 NADP-dependent oxidoreductase [Leuconostoc gasicomitatum]MBZ6013864.1 NADP-dependent oxidoreductase [Leuconostoc gelidum subsp. gelidum]
MKVAQLNKYAKDFQLTVRNVPVPDIKEDEVLIRVKEAAVNPLEKLIGTGSVKLIQDYDLPVTMGNELTGIIEKTGANVTKFKKNDAIYSRLSLNQIGAFAEYIAVPESDIGHLPLNLDFKSGAAAALTGLTAYQGFFEELEAKAGETVFIPGGSGSFGQLAIPIAKSIGLKVIVSGNSGARDRTLQLGADQYISFETQNYWELINDVDYVIDTLGPDEFDRELSIIKSGGRLLSLRTGPNKQFAVDHNFGFAKKQLFSLAGSKFDRKAEKKNVQYRFIFVRSDGSQLRELSKIIEQNNIVPAVDPTVFHIEDINDAMDLVFNGRPKGKVLITF